MPNMYVGHQVIRVTTGEPLERAARPESPPDVAIMVLPDPHTVRWLATLNEGGERRHILPQQPHRRGRVGPRDGRPVSLGSLPRVLGEGALVQVARA